MFHYSFKDKYISQPEKINLFVNHESTKDGNMGNHYMEKCETFIHQQHAHRPSI